MLQCHGTVTMEQTSGCSAETEDDTAHFQVTSQGLSVPHLMCQWIEGTSTTARRCCGIFFVILAPDTKLPTYLLTYFMCILPVMSGINWSSDSSRAAQLGASLVRWACWITGGKSSRGAERKRQSISQGKLCVIEIIPSLPVTWA